MEYEYLFPEFLEEDDPSFFDALEDLSSHTKGGSYYPRQCPPYKYRPRYCRPKYPCPSPCPPIRPQCSPRCYPLYPLPQCPRPCYPSYPCQRYPPQWLYPRPFPQRPYYPSCQLPCPPYWGRPKYPQYPQYPQYPCDLLESY